MGSQYGNPSHNALLWRGLWFCPLGDGWCPSRRYVELLRPDHPFSDLLDLCSRRPVYRDCSRRIVSSHSPIKRIRSPNPYSMAQNGLSWRWPFWVVMIYSGVCLILHCFIVPETFAPVLLQRKARRLRKADPVGNKDVYAEHERGDWSAKGVIHRAVFRPVEMVLKEKILVLVTVYLSFVYGILYCRECFWTPFSLVLIEPHPIVFEALPVVFIEKRNFSYRQLGLIYMGMFHASAGCLGLTLFQSCLWRRPPGGCNLCLGFEEDRGARGKMGGFPTSGDKTNRCNSCRSTPGSRLLLARLDRRIH